MRNGFLNREESELLRQRDGIALSRLPIETLQMLAHHANRLLNDMPEDVPGSIAEQLEAVTEWLTTLDRTLTQNRVRHDIYERSDRVLWAFGGKGIENEKF